MTDDSVLTILIDALDALEAEEYTTESQFGVGDPNEDYNATSKLLRERLRAVQEGEPAPLVEVEHRVYIDQGPRHIGPTMPIYQYGFQGYHQGECETCGWTGTLYLRHGGVMTPERTQRDREGWQKAADEVTAHRAATRTQEPAHLAWDRAHV